MLSRQSKEEGKKRKPHTLLRRFSKRLHSRTNRKTKHTHTSVLGVDPTLIADKIRLLHSSTQSLRKPVENSVDRQYTPTDVCALAFPLLIFFTTISSDFENSLVEFYNESVRNLRVCISFRRIKNEFVRWKKKQTGKKRNHSHHGQ